MSKDIVPGSPADLQASRKELIAAGRELIKKSKSSKGLDIPKNLDEMVSRIKDVSGSRDVMEIELSAMLCRIDDDKAWVSYGHKDLASFAENELSMSPSKARTMANNFRHFVNLGLDDRLLASGNINFSKFKMLIKPINLGLITSDNIEEWLPRIANSGPHVLPTGRLTAEVRALLSSDAVVASDPVMKFSVMMRTSEVEGFDSLLNAYCESLGTDDVSEALIHALSVAASDAVADDQAVAAFRGVKNMVGAIAKVAPVVPVLVPTSGDYDFDNLGCNPVKKIYGDFVHGSPVFCLAASPESAATHLGIELKAVREFDFSISPELLPATGFSGSPGTFDKIEEPPGDPLPNTRMEEQKEDPEPKDEPVQDIAQEETEEEQVVPEFAVGEVVVTVVRGAEVKATVLEVAVDGSTITYKVKNCDEYGDPMHKARPRKCAEKDILRVSPIKEKEAEPQKEAKSDTEEEPEESKADSEVEEDDIFNSVFDEADKETEAREFISTLTAEWESSAILKATKQVASAVQTVGSPSAAKDIIAYFRDRKLGKKSDVRDLREGLVKAAVVAAEYDIDLKGVIEGA